MQLRLENMRVSAAAACSLEFGGDSQCLLLTHKLALVSQLNPQAFHWWVRLIVHHTILKHTVD